ncbi:MAG: cystathionine gamma-synthase [Roseiflexaceae bacterium]
MPSDTTHDWSLTTRLIHDGERIPNHSGLPTSTPIYTTSTFVYRDFDQLEAALSGQAGFTYGRNGNPTHEALEQAMATAEGGAGAVLFSSGMAAMYTAIMAAGTPAGQKHPAIHSILVARDIYGTTTVMLETFFASFASQAIAVHACDMCDLAALDRALAEHRPEIVVVEQITNPLLRVIDIAAIAERAHANGATLIVDNTITSPIVQRPLTLGADLVVHSATKYFGGHGDVSGGVVVTRTSALRQQVHAYLKILGGTLGPFETQQILRGMKTLTLRVRQQCQNAAVIAAWLEQHPAVDRVYYPGLASHPQHLLACRDFGGLFGAMVSFDLCDPQRERLRAFIEGLQLVLPAATLGDIYTLVSVPARASHRDLSPAQRAERGIGDGLIRLSIGIEDVNDIRTDLDRALTLAQAVR